MELNVVAAADGALRLRASQLAFIVGAIRAKEQPSVSREPSSVTQPQGVVTVAPSFDWSCVAQAETGSDFTAHGPSYSSAYGVMNEAIRENAPADVAARILTGTASPGEQLTMAESIEAKHGVTAWAPGTVARCAR